MKNRFSNEISLDVNNMKKQRIAIVIKIARAAYFDCCVPKNTSTKIFEVLPIILILFYNHCKKNKKMIIDINLKHVLYKMGIPYYFYSLTQKYRNILLDSEKIQSIPTDILCLDFNGIIHTVIYDILQKNITDEDIMINTIWDKVLYYIDYIKPKKIIICTDGVAPLAKMFQQRKRRYLTIHKNKLDNIENIWDTNAITTGTNFMNKLNIFIKNKIRYSTSKTEIIYSGSDEHGEGEHKIFDKLLLQNDENLNILIHGLDADLLILSLMSHRKNIFIFRETIDNITKKTVYNYLKINELRYAIINELVHNWNLQHCLYSDHYSLKAKDLIETYCVMCSILGNDFIPHLSTLNLKSNGMEKVMTSTKYAVNNNDMLVMNGSINYKCLTEIFTDLSKLEDKDMHSECENYIKRVVKNIKGNTSNISDLYGIKNKDILANKIYNNPSKWRHEYYNSLFGTNISLCSSVVSESCENYIKGIYWTYAYYKKYDLDHHWYYPYTYPPSIKDISNYSIANKNPEIVKNGTYLPNYIQLLIVLPKESKHLVNDKYIKYFDCISNGLCHMYPDKYQIQTFLKTHLWECCPVLPTINIQYIIKLIT